MISCPSCGERVAASARFCPHCGEQRPGLAPTHPAIIFAIACTGVFVLLGVVAVNQARVDAGKPSWFGSGAPAAADSAARSVGVEPASRVARGTTLYAHAPVNVRGGPGTEQSILRTLARGDSVRVGPANADGWAPVEGGGGYVYRASERLRPEPPRP
ncbi:MAG: zinc ribbon domain-containing protein [Longimicrobiaceae bacterium]